MIKEQVKIFIQDERDKVWLEFKDPIIIICAYSIDEVLVCLHKVEELLAIGCYYAAGFISYEAASAFDSSLVTMPAGDQPLLWFALFDKVAKFAKLRSSQDNSYAIGAWSAELESAEFAGNIAKIHDKLRAGDSYQVNFTYRLCATFTGQPLPFFEKLASNQQSWNMGFIQTADFAVCSASPELFFSKDGSLLRSRPMKGTAKRKRTPQKDVAQGEALQNCEKNRAENLMIVDMIRNDMGRIAVVGSVKVPKIFNIESYPTVWQMTSSVEAESDAKLSELFSALFPCASITGAPKVATMEIIKKLEKSPRGIYCGALGFVMPDGRMQFNVPIRTAFIDRAKQSICYAVGGGIVNDSTADDEFKESRLKAEVIMRGQPEFELLETILCEDHTIFLLDEHLQRLADSADFFGIPCPLLSIEEDLEKVAESSKQSLKIRLLLNKSGHYQLQISSFSKPANSAPVSLVFASSFIDKESPFLKHKSTNRAIYQQFSFEQKDGNEVVLWNRDGEVCETTIANIVVKKDGELRTPQLSCGLLNGCLRRHLLDRGIIKEAIITKDDLWQADEIFLINSLRKWRTAQL